MRKTFAPLDDVLIERLFQPVSDLITYRIGINRTATACFCTDVACLAWIVSRVRELSNAVGAWNAGAAFLDLTLLLLGLVALVSLRMLFRRAGGLQANPLRQGMQPHRAIVLVMLASGLVQLHTPIMAGAADLAMLMCATSALYLGACAERPPMRRDWSPAGRARAGLEG
jgi:hypothetical protein